MPVPVEKTLDGLLQDSDERITLLERRLATLRSTPTGVMAVFAGSTPPDGWLECAGAYVSRAAYPALFSAIGTTYGSTTADNFRLPDARGRVLVGLDPAQSEFDTLGDSGGDKEVTLTVAQMPSHSHGAVTGAETVEGSFGLTDSTTNPAGSAAIRRGTGGSTRTMTDSAHSHSIPAQGGGEAHSNLQPYLVVRYMIKT